MSKRQLLIYEIVAWTLVMLCGAMVFGLSSQNADESSALSLEVTDVIIKLESPRSTIDRETEQYVQKHSLIRQFAHAAEYMLLGFLIFAALAPFKQAPWKKLLVSLFVCIAVASVDEWRQSFVSGRGSELTDVLTDAGGSLIGCCVALLFRWLLLTVAEKGAFWRVKDK